jgi:small subunit ribosomal protein S5
VQGAIQKAVTDAKKAMITVPIVNETIPFQLTTSFAGAKVLLKPASAGTGIIAGGAVRPIIELAGITNVLSKSLGSNNRINNAKATIAALTEFAKTDLAGLKGYTPAPAQPVKPPAEDKAAA